MTEETLAPLLFGMAATAATISGGWFALRRRRQAQLITGFAAGIVVGVALFDLVPEAINSLGTGGRAIGLTLGTGVGAYLFIDQALRVFARPQSEWRGVLAPFLLTLHSLVDGFGIGVGFGIDERTGVLIAAAVLAHDYVDGVNTVAACLGTPAERRAPEWLLLNGAAPLVGVVVGLQMQVSARALGMVLAGFAGAFLYVGLSELLVRSRDSESGIRATIATVAGMLVVALLTEIIR